MWEKIRVVFTIPELRKKILFTLVLLAVYRIGWQIPLPIVDQKKMGELFRGGAAKSSVVASSAFEPDLLDFPQVPGA